MDSGKMASSTAQKTKSVTTNYAYQRVENDLRAKVHDGRLPAGTMLASRHKLAREYGVSLSTAQQAIANLIADGTLEASDRRGTFVSYRTDTPHETVPALAESFLTPTLLIPANIPTAMLGIVATARIDGTAASDIGSIWAHQAIRSLEKVFSAAGGTTRFFDRYPAHLGPYERGIDDANAISMTEAIKTLRSEGAAALAIVGLCDGSDMSDEIVAAVDVERIPVVYLSWHEIRPPIAQVYYDNNFAGYQAAQHLLRKGYSPLLFVAPFQEDWLWERIGSAKDAVRHAGLPPETLHVYPSTVRPEYYNPDLVDTWTYEVAKQAFRELKLFRGTGTDERWGILAPNDFTAHAVLRAAGEQDKVAGRDYGLVGFDDAPQSYSVGLTTVRPPIEAMGEEAGRLLLRALQGERSGLQMRLRPQVVPRASTNLNFGVPSQESNIPSNYAEGTASNV